MSELILNCPDLLFQCCNVGKFVQNGVFIFFVNCLLGLLLVYDAVDIINN